MFHENFENDFSPPILTESEDGPRPPGLPPRLLLGGAPGKGRHGVLLDTGRAGGRILYTAKS